MLDLRFMQFGRVYRRAMPVDLNVGRDYFVSQWIAYDSQRSFVEAPIESRELSQESFDRLTQDWIDAIRYSSSLDDITNEANYLTIIGYGNRALPYIFADLRESPKAWFVALRKITGHNPIPADKAGSFRDMVTIWLHWADKNGY